MIQNLSLENKQSELDAQIKTICYEKPISSFRPLDEMLESLVLKNVEKLGDEIRYEWFSLKTLVVVFL